MAVVTIHQLTGHFFTAKELAVLEPALGSLQASPAHISPNVSTAHANVGSPAAPRRAANRDSPGTLPRSRHLPVAVTEGSLTEKVNKYGVRPWTDWARSCHSNSRFSTLLATGIVAFEVSLLGGQRARAGGPAGNAGALPGDLLEDSGSFVADDILIARHVCERGLLRQPAARD